MYPLDQKSRAPKRRKPTGTVKKEDISEEEPVTQKKKNAKSQLAKRRRSKSGVTEDEVGDICSLGPRPKQITVWIAFSILAYTGIDTFVVIYDCIVQKWMEGVAWSIWWRDDSSSETIVMKLMLSVKAALQ